jgi:hypothetical protein
VLGCELLISPEGGNALFEDQVVIRRFIHRCFSQKVHGPDFQGIRKAIDILKRNISLATFNRADVSAVKTGNLCKLLLREILGFPQQTHVLSDYCLR